MFGKTLYDKLWAAHVVKEGVAGSALIYIDRHYVHEVSSPQAFEGLSINARRVWRNTSVLGIPDHNVSTREGRAGSDASSVLQLTQLERNCAAHHLPYIGLHDERQGIIHVTGPELGQTLPGISIVCGDSHTSTHGAFAALAFGIGTSEVEHVLATQTLMMKKAKNCRVIIDGSLRTGVTAKDVALHLIRNMGVDGGVGYALEFCGTAIKCMSMDERMTLCNMAIEAGARSALVAFDRVTLDYLRGSGLRLSPEMWDLAVANWGSLVSDTDAVFDKTVVVLAGSVAPMATWGTTPAMCVALDELVPDPAAASNCAARDELKLALEYMGIKAGMRLSEIPVDKVFIGSCTNSRLSDLRDAAMVLKGQHIASTIRQAIVVPGSGQTKRRAEEEGLDAIFRNAGFEWRQPGCSMCIGMNGDSLSSGERCASTSNRNVAGRQGPGSRTHLMSPRSAALAALSGYVA